MSVEITRPQAPPTSIVITDTQGHYCVIVAPVEGGVTVQHDPTRCVETAFLSSEMLKDLAGALVEMADAADGPQAAEDASQK